MKFKLKKLIALGLTLAMTCSALSMPAYALNVVDNPEVSTDGTNSVDSSTFETVEITTDENGNTVIGTDETESETTTPTEVEKKQHHQQQRVEKKQHHQQQRVAKKQQHHQQQKVEG